MLQQFLKYGMSIKVYFQKQGKRLLLKLVHLKKIMFNPKLNAINQKKKYVNVEKLQAKITLPCQILLFYILYCSIKPFETLY